MRVVLCTAPPEAAATVARHLLQHGAACVNVLPGVTSFYRWEGRDCEDAESLLVIKAPANQVDHLHDSLRGVHPYELPEWVVLDVDPLTSRDYRAWVHHAGREQS